MKPYSEACERNKQPILDILREVFADRRHVLELGSGTGQHAVYFARHLPHLIWQSSDVADNHDGIRAWLEEAQLDNLRAPLALEVNQPEWPVDAVDAVFSANTAHIMDWRSVEAMFAGVGRVLEQGGVMVLYGPFSYDGEHTAESNARFHRSLQQQDPAMGIRDFADIDALARAQGLRLVTDAPMPANNRTLVWRRK